MNEAGYAFSFKGIDTHCADEYQKDALLYSFESEKLHHTYTVRIERYVNGLHCIKFFDESDSQGTGCFSHLSSTYEPRRIFRTIVDVALDVLRKNNSASFLFIGAADGKDVYGLPTRRYRVYKLYLSDFDLRDSIAVIYHLCRHGRAYHRLYGCNTFHCDFDYRSCPCRR